MTQPPGTRVVVTGAASRIGAAVATELSTTRISVLGLDKEPWMCSSTVPGSSGATDRGPDTGRVRSDASRHLHAPTLLMRRQAGRMARRRYGRIVTVTSIHDRFSEPTALAYD